MVHLATKNGSRTESRFLSCSNVAGVTRDFQNENHAPEW